MVLALLRRVTPAGLLLASLAWLACSPDSDITGPVNVGGPNLAVTAGETYGWTTASGVTVTMQTLGALMENGQSQAFGIDDDNDVIVGKAQAPSMVAFYWTAADGMQMIDAEGWIATDAYDVRGDVIVGLGFFEGAVAAFRRIGAEMQPLYPDAGLAVAEVVYKDNTAFGWRRNGSSRAAVEWRSGIDRAWLSFGDGINVKDANDSGFLVGAVSGPRAILWVDYPKHLDFPENQILLEPLPGTSLGQAEGVSENTKVAGHMWASGSHNRAFIWDPVNETVELPGLVEGHSTKALDINDSELVVGESELADGNEHAVAWINRQPVDLHPSMVGATISTAQAVNNNGLIAGYVRIDGGWQAVAWSIGDGEPPTPEEQLDELKGEIANLAASGVLSDDEANSMTSKVDNALKKIGQGKTGSAINKLGALINQIGECVSSGILTSEEAEPLLDLAQGAIDGLSGG
jgi:uncharacterized membrane protein